MVERVLEVSQGRFELDRHPLRLRQPLRAWDAADELALRFGADHALPGPIGVVNDAFGALTVALDPAFALSDSENSRIAITRNRSANGQDSVELHSSLTPPGGRYGSVFIKVPDNLGLLEDQLHRLRPHIDDATVVVGAAMTRRIRTATLEQFERIIGPTTTSRAAKKARLVRPVFDSDLTPAVNPWPVEWEHDGLHVVSHAGVFSAERLDNGTRLLLDNLPAIDGDTVAVDLGCGNGMLGLALARSAADAELLFVDESHRALESSRAGWQANFDDRAARFLAADRLVNVVARSSVDLIVTNPPCHEDRVVTDATAWDFFVDAFAVLRPGGRLVVVGNRHLGHHAKLGKIFGRCETVASSPQYVVLSAVR